MISNKRNRKKNIRGMPRQLGNRIGSSNQRTRSRRNSLNQPSLESLRSMILKGRLGIFKLVSQPEKP
jgi:hypothetical protein